MGAPLAPYNPGARPSVSAAAAYARTLQGPKDPKLLKQAQDFEAVFLETTLGHMMSGLTGEGPLGGGGTAAETWRGLLNQHIGKSIAAAGGVGIAASVYRELLKLQGQSASQGSVHAS